jgi:23S rRNA-/tRNA-specific pseudouridylate synthase
MKAPLRVRYDDGVLLVVDKPHGVATQGSDGDLYSILNATFDYIGLHHRLDQAASGLLLLTTNRKANKGISKAFKSHAIQRRYLAVLSGRLPDSCTWSWPLDGRTATTHVRLLGYGRGKTAVEVSLETGRTHQIRKHASMAGYPLIGDRRYGGEAGKAWPRLALHAHQLAFHHPISGEQLELVSPVPVDLTDLWNACIHPGESRVTPKP